TRFSRDWSSDVCSSDLNSESAASQKYALQHFRIDDSLQTARRKARNHFAEVKYNYKHERDEKLKLQASEAKMALRQIELENSRRSEERRVGKERRYRRW